MEQITIGQIVSAIGVISVIATFIGGIIVAVSKWWKSRVTDKFTAIDNKIGTMEKSVDNRFEKVEERLEYVEIKRNQYEQEVESSKLERKVLLKGELAALKGLYEISKNDMLANSIQEIEEYMVEKSHN